MTPEILDYIESQRVGVLAVEMLDGSPHGATVHFAHTNDPLVFFFETYKEYRKAEPILKNKKTRATFVIGSDESNMKTFQLDGEIIFFKLTPTWWRFTDWTRSEGKYVLASK